MSCVMASIPNPTPDQLTAPLSSNSNRPDAIDRWGSRSHVSRRDETVEDATVTPRDKWNISPDDVINADVTATESLNGVHCQIITTDDASTEISESVSPASIGDDASHLRPEVLRSVDSDSNSSTQTLNPKTKLVRCQAVYDDASPSPTPPPPPSDLNGQASVVITEPLEEESSATINTAEMMDKSHSNALGSSLSDGDPSPAMSRDSSIDNAYTDSTGTNLEDFIVKTLNKNKSDRSFMLRLEADMIAFVNDAGKEKWKFPPMTSYLRMLVHRVAAFFGLDHNVDEHGKSVVVSRLQNTRIPDFRFRDHLRDELLSDDQPKKSILKRHRDCTSLEDNLGVDRITLDERKSKSLEERTEEYLEARSRIFREMPTDGDESSASVKENGDDLHGSERDRACCLRSGDSSGYGTNSSQLRVGLSFNNVTILSRGDNQMSIVSNSVQYSRAESVSSTISNSGSLITIPSTATSSTPPDDEAGGDGPCTGPPFLPFSDDHEGPVAIWVASTISQIPPGSVIINPKKGEPYKNPDGSVFRWYPPPHLVAKKDAPVTEEFAPDQEVDVTVNDKPSSATPVSLDQSQDIVKASTCSSSKTASTVPDVSSETKNQKIPQVSRTKSTSTAPSSAAMVQALPSVFVGKSHSGVPAYTHAPGAIVSNRLVVPPPDFAPAYTGSSASVPKPVPSFRFVCPQAVGYHPGPAIHHVPDGSPYGYVPAYPAESYQVSNFPPVALPLPPAESYQQIQPHVMSQPVAVVQYSDKPWNRYPQPMTVFPGRESATGQMYYPVDSSQSGISGQAHQYPVQLVVVSSAADPNHGQPVVLTSQPSMMTGGVVVPANVRPTYLGSGSTSSGTHPQYVQYAYHQPNQPLGGAAGPVMPLYPNVVALPVPAGASSVPPPRGQAPCLVPVAHPPVNHLPLSIRSPSPKTFQFSVPPPTGVTRLRAPSVDPPVQHQDFGPDPVQGESGSGHVRPSNPPSYNPRKPRFESGRHPQANIAFPNPMNVAPGDLRRPRLPHQQMLPPSLPSNLHRKSRLNATSTGALAPVEARKPCMVPQPRVGVTAEDLKGSTILEVCGVPPTMSRQKVNSYLADLMAFGAKEFHVHDDPLVKPKDVACVGSAAVIAVFDSPTSAQKALRDHRGNGYHLQSATRTYNLNHRS